MIIRCFCLFTRFRWVLPLAGVLVFAGAARAVTVDLSAYDSAGSIAITQPNADSLEAGWNDQAGTSYRATFDLRAGQPLFKTLATKPAGQNDFKTLAQEVDPRFRVTLGSRVPKTSWPYIFFERIDGNSPAPVTHASRLDVSAVRVISESANRVKIVFSPLLINNYVGELTCFLYDGSPFVQLQASMKVSDPWVAYIFDALFYGNLEAIAYRDRNGAFQKRARANVAATEPGNDAALTAKHRLMMATFPDGTGTLAAFAPPHTGVYPTDFSNNFGFLQAGKTFFGTRMSPSADSRYRPWIDAPEGSTQRMDVFLLLGPGTPEQTLATVLTYTNGDVFKSVPGHYAMAIHFHPEIVAAHRGGGDTLTSFKQAMKAVGIQIAQPAEFHGPGHPMNNATDRLAELSDMYRLFADNSDSTFLFVPGEEYNNFFGGHWSYMFPKPVYFTGWSGQGGRAYKQTNVTSGGVTYPTVYQIGDTQRMLQLLRDEGGIAWASHPRVKGSRTMPDSYVDTDFYRDPLFQVGSWKAMPMDFSKDRLGYRSLQLMDETAQWGYRKFLLGETDTFEAAPNHELYAHVNVNYVQLPAFPPKDDWSSIVDALRNGRFFNSTGEVLIYSWNASATGVQADVEWYFPPAFAEITWGDADGIHKLKKPLPDLKQFGRGPIRIDADLAGAKWVRFEFWDVARNGAFTQPHWFSAAAEPSVVTGSIASFTLMNTDSDSPVPGYDPIPSGAVLDRTNLPPNLTIRANSSPLIMDRVVLKLDSTTVTRTAWPYTLGTVTTGNGIGDSPAFDLSPTTLSAGSHTLTATPYRGTAAGEPRSLSFSVVGNPPPAVPTGLTATGANHAITLAWQAATGATSYNVKRSTTVGGPYQTIASTNAPTYTDGNLKNGVPYFYVVSTVGTGESANSAEAGAAAGRPQTLAEHFAQGVAANADVPIGTAAGWRAIGKSSAGAIVDYTSSIPAAKNSPNIADNAAGADGTEGYLVAGLTSTVNPVLAWVETTSSLQNLALTGVTFFTKNGSTANLVRVAIRLGNRWYVSTQAFGDTGGNAAWLKHTFVFTPEASQWRSLDEGTLVMGGALSDPLPNGRVTAVGFFAEIKGEKVRLDEFTVIANQLTAFQLWQLRHYGSTNSAEAAPEACPGNDGVSNLHRFAFNAAPAEPVGPRLPAFSRTTASGLDYLSLVYTARMGAAGITYVVEVSNDLSDWKSGESFTTPVSSAPLDAESNRVTVRDNVPMTLAPQRFMRLKTFVDVD